MTNPLRDLESVGQSVWLDYIRRSLLSSGDLARLIADDGLSGVTANPTIFEKAIVGSTDYDAAIEQVAAGAGVPSREALYEGLAVADIQAAADLLRPVYDRTHGADGFVSLEVAPGLAHDTDGTVAEARRLWAEVGRPNLLVKVPGTREGVPAIEQLIAQGINVNVTLLFSLSQYEAVAAAFLRGLAKTPDPARIASVASIFVSRVDTKVDAALDARGTPAAGALRGRIGIANGRALYRRYLDLFHGPGFDPWRARGARPQRLLWASTSTMDPEYRDTLYLEELAGPETVTTVPPATLDAFRDHGRVAGARLADGLERAQADLTALAALGIDLADLTQELQDEGVKAFAASFTTLLDALETKRDRLVARRLASLPWQLADRQSAVDGRLATWGADDLAHRFWRKDPTAWPGTPASDVSSRMGWIGLPEAMEGRLDELEAFAREVVADGIRSVVVLGMGGSSLAPDVFARVFGPRAGYPALFVLDSTHPRAIADLTARLDLPHTLFLVSSKSGTTLEPLSFYAYFREHVARLRDDAGRQFVAITDPGTPLEKLARDHGFRRIFSAPPDVGGRYSALTVFGLVPAALLGVDLRTVLDRARRQAEAGAFCVPASENPGFRLGAALGELGRAGRNKVTFFAEPPLEALPDWIEQLIAESTGKQGRGLVPVVAEPAGPPGGYGTDRVFVSLERGSPDPATVGRAEALSAAGHPVLRLPIESPVDLGAEFFRWETAVAVAGPVLGIDPYDQPDVELAKQLARSAMGEPAGPPAPPADATAPADDGPTLRAALERWGTGLGPGAYIGLQAYLAPALATWDALGTIRTALRRRFGCATTLGYGPRFLHSTGQLHKGGPPTGWFLQLMDDFRQDLAVPGTDYTFGRVLRAQALGDLQALRQRGRPVLRVELGSDVLAGLDLLRRSVDG